MEQGIGNSSVIAEFGIAESAVLPRRWILAGASGLLGQALLDRLREEGVDPLVLVRRPPATSQERFWDPRTGQAPFADIAEADVVVHLGGSSIATRWTARAKATILDSRLEGTGLIRRILSESPRIGRTWINASACGYHAPSSLSNVQQEDGPAGTGFLTHVVQRWEAAASLPEGAGRVCHARFGVVLSPRGGALRKMLPAFRLGLGGPLGAGTQPFPWIHVRDAVEAVLHLARQPIVAGAALVVAPEVVSQARFAQGLGQALGRPAKLPTPGWLLRGLFGEMAREVLLEGPACRPAVLLASGFRFRHPTLETALRPLLAS